jgi:hypothetical protein
MCSQIRNNIMQPVAMMIGFARQVAPHVENGIPPDGMYRVGPLGRLNVADGCTTPLADKETCGKDI